VRHRFLAALALLTLLLTAPAAGAAGSAGAAAESPDEGPAAALAQYFDFIERGNTEAADALCHSRDEGEALLALALTTLRFSQEMCAHAVARRFGEKAVRASVGRPIGSGDVAAEVTATDGTARVTYAGGVSFPMVRVDGRWKLSMRELAKDMGQTPDRSAVVLRQMAQAHTQTAREVVDGKHKSAADVRAALEKRGYRRGEPQSQRAGR
jgi:hypothetical protein